MAHVNNYFRWLATLLLLFFSFINGTASNHHRFPTDRFSNDSGQVTNLTDDDSTSPEVYHPTAGYKSAPATGDWLCFTAEEPYSSIYRVDMGGNSPDLQFSLDEGKTWEQWLSDERIQLQETGDKVYVRGINPGGFNHGAYEFQKDNTGKEYTQIVVSGSVAASGNVMSLIDGEGTTNTIPCDYCFASLFCGSSGLTKAPRLPATTLTKHCYESMFIYCSQLEQTPELPATELADYCYKDMFLICNKLTKTSELPAMEMKKGCYERMFHSCFSLEEATQLPATKMADYCYAEMFGYCSLINAPELPATELADYCYSGMFYNCEELRHAPSSLPAKTLKNHCYSEMFQYCRSLEKAPELPATELADYCYNFMFASSGIAQAPASLPATELKTGCYRYMFAGCGNLAQAPELPATSLVSYCYEAMFTYCANLNYIKVDLLTLDNNVRATQDWVSGVLQPGVFIFPCESRYDKHGDSEVPVNFKIVTSPVAIFQNPDSTVLYIDTVDCGGTPVYRGIDPPSAGEGTVFLHWDKDLTAIEDPDVYYYTAIYENMGELVTPNDLCFTAMFGDATISIESFGGNNPDVKYTLNGGVTWLPLKEGDIVDIPMDEKVYIKGYNPDGFSHGADQYTRFKTSGKIIASGNVMSLLDEEGATTEIPNEYCFAHLFENTTIYQAPKVPATTLKESCYDHMFAGCEILRRVPDLPATKMYTSCYGHMFAGCTIIDSVPLLPAMELAPYCYANMFQNCLNLWEIYPELPATQLAVGCYKEMFAGNTSMTYGVALPATQLADSCYAYMYHGCTGLWSSVALPATELANYAYLSMYENCTSIRTCGAIEAIDLAEGCCEKMFKGCTSIGEAPVLHATELKDKCYKEMFYECAHLEHIEVGTLTLDNDFDATKDWVKGVDESGVFVFPCKSRYDKHGISEVPDNFTIKSYPILIFMNPDGRELWRDTSDCEKEVVYRGERPTYEGLVFVGWDRTLYTPREGGFYYFVAQYKKEEDVVRGPWLCFTAEEAGSKIWYTNLGENHPDLLYSIDGGISWLPMEPSSSTSPENALTLENKGSKVYIKGNNPDGFSHSASDITYFGMSGRIAATGSVMSLVDSSGVSTDIPCAYCFDSLFAGCEALTQAPKLTATNLADYCYRNMFSHCTNLTDAPALNAEKMKEGCYSYMFSYCESIKYFTDLPSFWLEKSCYESMFQGCSSLEEFYNYLHSPDLEERCYQGMFKDCISLKKAPIIRAKELQDHSCAYMFEGCSSLTYINVDLLTLDNDVDATKDWVKGVDLDGVFIFPCGSKYDKHGVSEVPDNFIIQASPIIVFLNPDGEELWRDTINCSSMPEYKGEEPTYGEGKVFIGWDKKLDVITVPDVYYYIAQYNTPSEMDINKILCFTAEEANSQVWYTNNEDCRPDLQYSKDGGKTWVRFEENDKVTLENVGDKVYLSGININGFTARANSFGYITFGMSGQIAASGSVMSLIDGTGETPLIPSSYCFHSLFSNCEALTHAPELPATILTPSCYSNMFYGCKNLTEAPALPATEMKEACYNYMFYECTSLTTPPELPATQLDIRCYDHMFYGCTSLTTPPNLPATDLKIACYENMFSLSGLTKAPALPATKMATNCYQGMFYKCLDLKKAPTLPAMELASGCYAAMFNSCMNMTEAPELPAMDLKQYCYQEMFAGCTTLVNAPELPAKQLEKSCYDGMFRYCFNLNFIKVGVMSLDNNPAATTEWVEMIDGPGTFIFPCGSRYNKHGYSEVPNNFTIISSPVVVFQNPDGEELWRDTFGCAQTPVYRGETPTYGEGLVFAGWDKELTMLPDPDVYYFTAQYKKEEPYSTLDSMIIACDSFLLDGKKLMENTTWTDTVTDERLVINYHLLVSHPTERDSFLSTCESFSYKGVTYSENAEWSDTMLSSFGCDSIITYHLTLHKGSSTDSTITAEDSFSWKDTTFTKSTSWTETLQTAFGCDSVINYHLEITSKTPDPAIVIDKDTSACDVLVFKGITYTENASWNDTLPTANGGDSIIVYHLTIHKGVTVDSSIVADGSYTWKDITYKKDASWSDTLQTITGCDSIVNYHLTVNKEKVDLQLTVEDELILVLPGSSTLVGYKLSGGEGSKYEVRYDGQTISSGDVTNDSTVNLTCPSSLEPGAYEATMEMCDDEGNCAEKEFTFNVMRPDDKQKSYYVKVWNDVVICRNGDGQFLDFQWYKNGKKCENASLQYFNDVTLLDGEYMVFVSEKGGKSYFIEPITYEPVEASYAITANPNVVKKGEEFTVKVTGVAPDDLRNARIVVYRADGVVEKILDEVKEESSMQLRSGEFVIVLTVNDGKNANCKVLVK